MYPILKGERMSTEEKCNQEKACVNCQITYKMPFKHCCLYECGEHEFCKNCDKGMYLKGE